MKTVGERSRKGVALLLVIIVLVTLLIVATAFATSMVYQEKASVTFAASLRAGQVVESAVAYSIVGCTETVPPRDATPGYDLRGEFEPTKAGLDSLKARLDPGAADNLEYAISTIIQDEQAKVNVNAANKYILGNVIGSCVLIGNLDSTDSAAVIDSAETLDPKGGYVVIGAEVAGYAPFEGDGWSQGGLSLSERGAFGTNAASHPAGTLAVDFRAALIAEGRAITNPDGSPGWLNYRTTDEIKKVLFDSTYNGFPVNLDFDPVWLDRRKDLLTCYSTPARQVGWVGARYLEYPYFVLVADPRTQDEYLYFVITDATGIEAGSVVELSDGANPYYDSVGKVTYDSAKGYYFCLLNNGAYNDPSFGPDVRVRVMSEAPINVNTASVEVLEALFYGLSESQQGGGAPLEYVTREEAAGLAELFVSYYQQPDDGDEICDAATLREAIEGAVEDGIITEADGNVILAVIAPGAIEDPPAPRFRTGRACFSSGGVFGIEAACSVTNPAGNQIYLFRTYRVVAVAAPEPEVYRLSTQEDFQKGFKPDARSETYSAEEFSAVHNGGNGHLVRSYPEFHNPPDEEFALDEDAGTGVEPAPRPLPSSPSNFRFLHEINVDSKLEPNPGWYGPYNDTGRPTGLAVDGQAIVLNSAEFTGYLRRDTQYYCQDPTCFAISFKLAEAPSDDIFFFDVYNGDDTEDRAWLYYDSTEEEFVLGVADFTFSDDYSSWRYPTELEADRWYNLKVFWKGGGLRGMAMYLEGEPVGQYSHGAYLTADVGLTDQTLYVDDASSFPDEGIVWIDGGNYATGGELAYYDSHTDTELNFPTGGRGIRMTTATEHKTGAVAYLLGYSYAMADSFSVAYGDSPETVVASVDVENILYTNGAQLADAIGESCFTFIATTADETGSDVPISATATSITVGGGFLGTGLGVSDFQERGYILIRKPDDADVFEIVYYDALGAAGPETASFESCLRGQKGTTAQPWTNNSPVFGFSLYVTDNTNYPNICGLKFDDEWAGWYEKDDERSDMFIGILRAGKAFPPRTLGASNPFTSTAAHSAGVNVIQIFRITNRNYDGQDDWLMCYAGDEDRNFPDEVTLIDSGENREPHTVHRQGNAPIMGGADPSVPDYFWFIAFEEFARRQYSSDVDAKVLKFPSGENIRHIPETFSVLAGNDGGGGLVGEVDDIGFGQDFRGSTMPLFRNAWTVTDEMIDIGTSDSEITVFTTLYPNADNAEWFAGNNRFEFTAGEAGLIKIGDEWIAYTDSEDAGSITTPDGRELQKIRFLDVVRGVFDTEPREHLRGSLVYFEYQARISRYVNPAEFDSGTLDQYESGNPGFLPLWGTINNRFPSEGYVKVFGQMGVEPEIISYTGRSQHGLLTPVRSESDPRLIYRGRFGTTENALNSDDILLYVPVRYDHRYSPDADHPTMAYYSLTLNGLRGKWGTIDYTARTPEGTELYAYGRFNSGPMWDETVGSAPAEGEIFRITPGADLQFQSDQLEIRFYFDYSERAYQNAFSTHIPQIESLSVTLRRPCRVLYNKELNE